MSKKSRTLCLTIALFMLIPTFSAFVPQVNGNEQQGVVYHLKGPSWSTSYVLRTYWGDLTIDNIEKHVPVLIEDISSSYWMIQFNGPIKPSWKNGLESEGAKIISYFPDFAFIIEIDQNDIYKVIRNENIVGAIPYLSGLKVHPELHPLLDDPVIRKMKYGSSMLVVDLLKEDPGAERELRNYFQVVDKVSSTRFLVGPDPLDVNGFLGIRSIEWIEPDHPVILFNNVSKEIIGVSSVIEDLGLYGTGQTVAIADTGLDTGVDDHNVDGDILADFDNRVRFANWAGTSPDDTHSHGTHVAGSVASSGVLSNGKIKGMAPKADIFFQGIATDSNALSIPTNTSLLFDQAYQNGARIHTNSWGSSVNGQYTTRSWDVDWFLYNYPDMIILYSAGNSGIDWFPEDGKIDNDSIGAPATALNCITVGASENFRTTGGYSSSSWSVFMGYKYTGSGYVYQSRYPVDPVKNDKTSNNTYGLAAFSSRGPTDDLRLKPDVVAPGTNILSDRSTKASSTGWGTFSGNSNYIFMGGTSMSTPITAGGVALIREYFNVSMRMDKPSGALMKSALINGAIDMTPGQYGGSDPTKIEVTSRPDNAQGWGRINISRSLGPKDGNMAFVDVQEGISTDENFTTYLKVLSPNQELRLTLAWSDHPGTLSASKHLVNDLDLVLRTPNGTIYRGNDFISPYGDTRDDTNNVEGIRIKNPSKGLYKVTVRGYNVPMDHQRFALVGNGDISNFSGVLKLDRTHYSTDNDTIKVQLLDQDLIGAGSVTVNVSSTTYTKGRMVTLYEDKDAGIFRGSIMTTNSSTSSPNSIHVSHDDIISGKYLDTDPSMPFYANATAKRPERIFLRSEPEYRLTFSTYERIYLEGVGEPNISAWWKFEGTSMDWRVFRDDGNSSFGDKTKDDGNYSDIWSTPPGMNGSYELRIKVEDHYLGTKYYPQFNISFDHTVPRFPKNLTPSVRPDGNMIDLNWDPTNETDLSVYRVYMNSSIETLDNKNDDWLLISEVDALYQNHTVGGLLDGIEYLFAVSATDGSGNESSLSVPVRATPLDTEPPAVILLTTPRTIVGTIVFKFTGSPDLEHVEIEYYNDSNGNGLKDDEGWLTAANGTPKGTSWDTTVSDGGPGDVDSMFIRFRGFDEVPNISSWMEVEGFRIDNTGPSSVEIIEPPDRVTNIADMPLMGRAEKNGYVRVHVNDVLVANQTCNVLGVFYFELNLTEGYNTLLLSAYDVHGAGPTNRSYEFTLDTLSPVVTIDGGQEIMIIYEIQPEPFELFSSSYDRGLDQNFTFLENITWTIIREGGHPEIIYGTEELDHFFKDLGLFNISLIVRDPAGNSNSTWLLISVVDTTRPIVSIDGPISVDERTSRTYNANVTDNDLSWFTRVGSKVHWNLTGPEVQISNLTQPTITVSFPIPGNYILGLFVEDGGGNNGTFTITILAKDRTSPAGSIIGPSEVLLGIPVNYSCNVTDNDEDFPEGASFNWNLTFIDAPPDEIWSVFFEGTGFSYNFTEPGFYTLLLTVLDASGNELSLPLTIEAIGDLVHPTIIDNYPKEDASFQFPTDLRVSVTFSEKMALPSFTGRAITVMDGSMNNVNFTFELKEGVLLNIIPEDLKFGTTYTFTVMGNVTDLWGNKVGRPFSASYRIRNYFELVFPDGTFPNSTEDNFTANETGFYTISLRFTNPVQVQTLIGSVTIIAYKPYLVNGKERIEKQQVSDYTVLPGNDSYTALVIVQLDIGLKYEISISKKITDIYDYALDWEQRWFFKTYLPPDIKDDEPPADDDNGIPDWLEDPTNWLIAAIVIIIIIAILIILAVVKRATRKKKLERMWNETSDEGPRRKRSEPGPEPQIEQGPVGDIGIPDEGAGSKDLYEPKPATINYEDLYKDVPVEEPRNVPYGESVPSFDLPIDDPDYIPPPPSINWDEDNGAGDEAEEDWGEEEEEESWER